MWLLQAKVFVFVFFFLELRFISVNKELLYVSTDKNILMNIEMIIIKRGEKKNTQYWTMNRSIGINNNNYSSIDCTHPCILLIFASYLFGPMHTVYCVYWIIKHQMFTFVHTMCVENSIISVRPAAKSQWNRVISIILNWFQFTFIHFDVRIGKFASKISN